MKKTALIVGGSTGMGLETAKLLAKQGVHLVLIARDSDKLATAKEQLQKFNDGDVETISTDLYNNESVQDLISWIDHDTKSIDYLLNAAGYFKPTTFLEHTAVDYHTQLGLNLSLIHI